MVRQRQAIISLPDLENMVAVTKVHESALDKIRVGQQSIITVDALPDQTFRGEVTKVALLPDAQSWWLNPDLKVYSTEVRIDGDTTMLRPGMSCSVEILVAVVEDVPQVPIQAVFREEGTTFCYVSRPDRIEVRTVRVGRHNDAMVAIREGLVEGDMVFLVRPAEAPAPSFPETSPGGPEGFPAQLAAKTREDEEEAAPASQEPLAEGVAPEEGRQAPWEREASDFRNLSPEERSSRMAEWRERLENLSPEERQRLTEQFRGRGGRRSSPHGGNP